MLPAGGVLPRPKQRRLAAGYFGLGNRAAGTPSWLLGRRLALLLYPGLRQGSLKLAKPCPGLCAVAPPELLEPPSFSASLPHLARNRPMNSRKNHRFFHSLGAKSHVFADRVASKCLTVLPYARRYRWKQKKPARARSARTGQSRSKNI